MNSSDIGAVKPDISFYEAALELVGTQAKDSIFIDDTFENVSTAKALGFHALHHRNLVDSLAFIDALVNETACGGEAGLVKTEI